MLPTIRFSAYRHSGALTLLVELSTIHLSAAWPLELPDQGRAHAEIAPFSDQ